MLKNFTEKWITCAIRLSRSLFFHESLHSSSHFFVCSCSISRVKEAGFEDGLLHESAISVEWRRVCAIPGFDSVRHSCEMVASLLLAWLFRSLWTFSKQLIWNNFMKNPKQKTANPKSNIKNTFIPDYMKEKFPPLCSQFHHHEHYRTEGM